MAVEVAVRADTRRARRRITVMPADYIKNGMKLFLFAELLAMPEK